MKTSAEHKSEGAGVVELRIAARPENVALARLALNGVATAAGAPPAVVADLKLAVSEACANAVQHAYAGSSADGEQRVTIRFAIRDRQLVVEVEDDGSGFEAGAPASWQEGDSEGRDTAGQGLGMGLTIVRSVTDELEIESGARGSRVVFSKAF
jgi:serine/threonine-protein kinase RsbW